MKTVLLLALMTLLVGCTHIEYVDRTVYVYPDRTWVQPVPDPTPPSKAEFSVAQPASQLGMLGNYSLAQSKQNATCNAQLNKIDQWILEHQAQDAALKK